MSRNKKETVPNTKYTFSFTACAARKQESLKVLAIYLEVMNWDDVRQQVLNENILQQRTLRSAKRVYRELESRLQRLQTSELRLLSTGTEHEQNQLLWLAICRHYALIYDFAVDVLREKARTRHLQLSNEDFNRFWSSKLITHSELESITESTRQKSRQVLFKMLREVRLVDDSHTLRRPFYSDRLINELRESAATDQVIFPFYHESLSN